MFEQFEFAPDSVRWAYFFWAIALVVLASAWGISRREKLLGVFGLDQVRSKAWIAGLRKRRILRVVVLSLAIVFLTVAALRPRSNPQKTTFRIVARDIAIVLDVSRSMLADDLKPNRLERAKIELGRLADHLKARGHGDRVGLVVFAGESVIRCPLTSNYTYFKSTLRDVTVKSTSYGGTRIGDAVRKTLSDLLSVDRGEVLPEKGVKAGETVLGDERKGTPPTFADILVLTDGEEPDPNVSSHPESAAEVAYQLGVGLYIVGLGSEEGSSIPVPGKDGKIEYLKYRDGSIVRSKLGSRTLLDMVNAYRSDRARYLEAATNNFDLVDFFDSTIGKQEGREGEETHVAWTEIFQPFLLTGLALYLVYLVLGERPRREGLRVEVKA
jgi:Ca-activated chloride channel homolog